MEARRGVTVVIPVGDGLTPSLFCRSVVDVESCHRSIQRGTERGDLRREPLPIAGIERLADAG